MLDLDRMLKRMKVTAKAVELGGTPACGFTPNARPWRVTLTREIKGEEKPLKLTVVILSGTEPTVSNVITCLLGDIEYSQLSLWDFAQEFNEGKTNEATERMYKSCKRVAPRTKRFFGDLLDKLSKAA